MKMVMSPEERQDMFDRALRDENPVQKAFAVLVLAEMDDAGARQAMEAAAGHADPLVRRLVAERMSVDGFSRYGAALRRLAADADVNVREAAFAGLVGDPTPEVEGLAVASGEKRAAGQGSILHGRFPVPEARVLVAKRAVDALRSFLAPCQPAPKDTGSAAACGALGALAWAAGVAEGRAVLDGALADSNEDVRAAAVSELRWAKGADATALAVKATGDASAQVRLSAVGALSAWVAGGAGGAPEVVEALRGVAAGDGPAMLRYRAARALPAGDPAAVQALIAVLDQVGPPFDAEVAAELARRGEAAGMARLAKLVADPMRTDSGRSSRLLELYPYVDALASLSSPEAEELLRRLRDIPGQEGLAAALVLARRGDRQLPEHVEDALSGKRGLDAQLLAAAVVSAR